MNDVITLTKNCALNFRQDMYYVTLPLINVHQALATCGVKIRDPFGGQTAAESISEELFANSFSLIMEISWE